MHFKNAFLNAFFSANSLKSAAGSRARRSLVLILLSSITLLLQPPSLSAEPILMLHTLLPMLVQFISAGTNNIVRSVAYHTVDASILHTASEPSIVITTRHKYYYYRVLQKKNT